MTGPGEGRIEAAPGRGTAGAAPWLRLFRLSNVPTVWTNAAAGAGLAAAAMNEAPAAGDLLAAAAIAASGGSLLYAGGMALNDVADATIDRARGAARPIVEGAISRRAAAVVAVGLLLAGTLLAFVASAPAALVALLLVAAIVGYDLLNKRLPAAIGLMGLCRGLLVVLGATAVDPAGWSQPLVVGPAAAVCAFVVLVTVAARREHAGDGSFLVRPLAVLLPAPLVAAGVALVARTAGAGEADPRRILIAAAFAAGILWWHRESLRHLAAGRVPRAITGWLAILCLGDGLLLAAAPPFGPAGWWMLAACAAGFVVTRRWQRAIAGS